MKVERLCIREEKAAVHVYIGGNRVNGTVVCGAEILITNDGVRIRGEKVKYEYNMCFMGEKMRYTERGFKEKFAECEWDRFTPVKPSGWLHNLISTDKKTWYTCEKRLLELKDRKHYESVLRGNVMLINETGKDMFTSHNENREVAVAPGEVVQ